MCELLGSGWSLSWVDVESKRALARGAMLELLREEVDSYVKFENSSYLLCPHAPSLAPLRGTLQEGSDPAFPAGSSNLEAWWNSQLNE